MASLLKNIAEPYSKDKVYNTKDMVLYNNLLYLCVYNKVSGEFNSSKWIEVQLTDLVQGKLRGIEDYSGKVIDASYVEQDDDYTYFGVPQKAFVDNETSFRTLNSNLAPKLLWTNSDITKGWWPPYTVELDIGNYDYIIVQLISTMDDTKKPFYIFTSIKEWYGNVTGALVFNGITYQRWITSITESLITFGSGAPNNSYAIPYKIYGFNITL